MKEKICDREQNAYARGRRRNWITTVLIVVGLVGIFVLAWLSLGGAPQPETATVLAPEGRKVSPIAKAMALPPIDGRQLRSEIVPSGKATHVIYPVFYGTDRKPNSPYGGVPLGTVILWVAAIVTAIAAAIFFIWKRKRLVITSVLMSTGLAFWAWSPQPKKNNPIAAAAYGHERDILRYGICSVSIPHSHKTGMLEAPSLLSFEFREDEDKHIVLQRVDTLATKPAFRSAYKSRHCLVVADGYYEWKAEGKKKLPFLYEIDGGKPFAFAGLWEKWLGEDKDASPLESCTIITTDANKLASEIHNRMPVILSPNDYELWLDSAAKDVSQVAPLLDQFPDERMSVRPVSTHVNNAHNK